MRLLSVIVLLGIVGSGCATARLTATTDLAGPDPIVAPPTPDGAPSTKDVELWTGSAPGGVEIHGETVLVKPESGLLLLGRTRVTVDRDPPLHIALLGVGCGFLTVVGAPCAAGWLIYYLLAPNLDLLSDPNRVEESKRRVQEALKTEARRVGADLVVFVDYAAGKDGSVARGFLLKRWASPGTSGAKEASWHCALW